MTDCTCIRGDDGRVAVPSFRCARHGWADTSTPAPALTDEQIDAKRVQVRAHDVDALCEAGDDYAESSASFDRWFAAVEARAARQERRRLWRVIDPLMDGVTDDGVVDRIASVGAVETLARAYRLGVSTALMEIAREPGYE